MTKRLSHESIINCMKERIPSAGYSFENDILIIEPDKLLSLCKLLKTAPGIELDYLSCVTAVDYPEYFELVYLFYSTEHNHKLTLKVRCPDKTRPSAPSLTPLYKGANFQEREIWDLFGIRFENHPKLKRIFLWESFPGHPLRKDFVNGR